MKTHIPSLLQSKGHAEGMEGRLQSRWRQSYTTSPQDFESDRLDHLASIAYWLDEGFRIPNVGLRFGWDSVAKLVPIFGDALGLMASLYLMSSLRRLNLPRVTMLRMTANVAID